MMPTATTMTSVKMATRWKGWKQRQANSGMREKKRKKKEKKQEKDLERKWKKERKIKKEKEKKRRTEDWGGDGYRKGKRKYNGMGKQVNRTM